uniref:Blue (Type1) copper domain-containing protein n=1 Tax=uncultured marine thaumarchaeote KM3_67_B07 TaxID=1456232 RepID=A0A075HCZ4_9ARCH|nr:blue (type1) copper domain-containing protein [uncultured marine thaumarchaeote KM3_67_B07]
MAAEAAAEMTAADATVTNALGSSTPGCEETDSCFIPHIVTIDIGDTVGWSNIDTAAHTVTSGTPEDGPSGVWDSSLIMAGGNFFHTFDQAGAYSYHCMVHPWMLGTVVVNLAETTAAAEAETEIIIPSWIKQNAEWWADGSISDRVYVSGLQWLISNEIMHIPSTTQGTGSDDVIPSWIKQNAEWWADGLISDRVYVGGIQWLITNGIMIISLP